MIPARLKNDCSHNRIQSQGVDPGRYLMDSHDGDLGSIWIAYIQRMVDGGAWFDYVFEDKADDIAKTSANPCNWNQPDWSAASIALNTQMSHRIIYNSLSHTSTLNNKPTVSPSMRKPGDACNVW